MTISIKVQEAPFDAGAELAAVMALDPGIGAVASFVGLVRDRNDGSGVAAMTLEHYPGMTERALLDIAEQAQRRWNLQAVTVIHRVGRLAPTDPIVLVIAACAHRGEAFAACEFIMDFLKTQAPFWKKEQTPSGERWVEARDADDQAAARWKQQ